MACAEKFQKRTALTDSTDRNTKTRYPKRRTHSTSGDTKTHYLKGRASVTKTTTTASHPRRGVLVPRVKREPLAFKPAVQFSSTDVLLVHFNIAEAMAAGSEFQDAIMSQLFIPLADFMVYTIIDENPKLPLSARDGEVYVTVCEVLKKVKLIAFNVEGEEWKTFAKQFQHPPPTGWMVQVDAGTTNDMEVQDDSPVVSDISPHEFKMIQDALRQYRKNDESLSKSTQTFTNPRPSLPTTPSPSPLVQMSPSESKSPRLIKFANQLKSLAKTLYRASEVLPGPALQDLEEMFDVDWMVEDMDKMVVGVISFRNGTGDDGKKRWRSGGPGKNEKRIFCQNDPIPLDGAADSAADGEAHGSSTAVTKPVLRVPEPTLAHGLGRPGRVPRSSRRTTQALEPTAEPVIVFRTLTKKRLATMSVPKPNRYTPPKSHKPLDIPKVTQCYICQYKKYSGTSLYPRIACATKFCKDCGDMPLCDGCFPTFHNV